MLLSKGFNFSPTHHFNLLDMILYVNTFAWHLTLRKHCFDEDDEQTTSLNRLKRTMRHSYFGRIGFRSRYS